MITCKVNRGAVSASIQGTATSLAAEACVLIRSIYKSIREEDEKSAKKFKEIIINEMTKDDGHVFSDVLDDDELEIDDNPDDEDDGDESRDALKKLLEGLERLKGMLDNED